MTTTQPQAFATDVYKIYRCLPPLLSTLKISKMFKWSDPNNNRMFQKNLKIKKVSFSNFLMHLVKVQKAKMNFTILATDL
jgi:hypothetical protein